MGSAPSTDRAIGRIGNLVANGAQTVVKDQISKQEDFWRHPLSMVVPSIVGGLAIMIAIGVFVFTSKCKGADDDRRCTVGDWKVSGALIVVGLVIIMTVQTVLAVRHPRATAEGALAHLFL